MSHRGIVVWPSKPVCLAAILSVALGACAGPCSAHRPSTIPPHESDPDPIALKNINVHSLDYSVLHETGQVQALLGIGPNWKPASPALRSQLSELAKAAEEAIRSQKADLYLDLFDPASAEYKRQEKHMLKKLFNPRTPLKQDIQLRDVIQAGPDWAVAVLDVHTQPVTNPLSAPFTASIEKNWVLDFRASSGRWRVGDPPFQILAGQVIDETRESPLDGARVTAAGMSTRTSRNGLFSFGPLPDPPDRLEVKPRDGRPTEIFHLLLREARHHEVFVYRGHDE